MSDKKYYVLLNKFSGQPKRIQLVRFGFDNELIDFACPKLARGNYLLKGKQHQFTKSELSEIMDGALYRPDTSDPVLDHDLDFFDNLEWVNPLVELIPVEELKKYG